MVVECPSPTDTCAAVDYSAASMTKAASPEWHLEDPSSCGGS
uniref:Uncharacterized protein n=1 Tax=Arundo donax TaxID=35708 RepID=A0A0A9DGT1_ARUDO